MVITDIKGLLGRRMIEAIVAAKADPARLALSANRRIKASHDGLSSVFCGRVTDHHRFLLFLHFDQHDVSVAAITRIDDQIDEVIVNLNVEIEAGQATVRSLIILLCDILRVRHLSTQVVLARTARDMSRFPTAGHIVAWAGLCPGQNESTGKRNT